MSSKVSLNINTESKFWSGIAGPNYHTPLYSIKQLPADFYDILYPSADRRKTNCIVFGMKNFVQYFFKLQQLYYQYNIIIIALKKKGYIQQKLCFGTEGIIQPHSSRKIHKQKYWFMLLESSILNKVLEYISIENKNL